MPIKARSHQDQLGLIRPQHRTRNLLVDINEFRVFQFPGQRNIDGVSRSLALSDIFPVPGVRVEHRVMGRQVEDLSFPVKQVIETVAVVNIPVDNEDAPQPVRLHGVSGRDPCVVKHAEPPCTILEGMVPRRSDQGETGVDRTADQLVHGLQTPAHGQPAGQIGLGTGRRIRGQARVSVIGRLQDPFDIGRGVNQFQMFERGRSRIDADQLPAEVGIEHPVDGLETVRMLGMGMARLV